MLGVVDWDPDLSDTWWPLAAVASLFISPGAIGLLVNLLFLWLFSTSLESRLGPARYLALFVAGGIAAAAGQELFEPSTSVPSVGLAGSIAALIGAYAVLMPRGRILCWVLIPFFVTFTETPALLLAVVWFGLQALSAFGQPPAAALVAGLLLGAAAVRPLAHGRPQAVEVSQPVY